MQKESIMQIREGGYYKQRNGLIRGPMLIDDDDTVCEVGQVSLLHPTRWDSKGLHIPRIHTKKNDAVDLVEAMAVFPMPELSPRDNTVANDEDGYILEFASDYYAASDDDGLYLFTRGRLLDMLKVRDGYNKRMVSLNVSVDTTEAREKLREALEQIGLERTMISHLAPLVPAQVVNISPRKIYSLAAGLAQGITDDITVQGFENDRDAATVLANQKKTIESAIAERLLNFLNMEGVSTFHDGGVVKGLAKTAMSEHATDSFAFTMNAKSWAEGGYSETPGLKPNEVAGAVSTARTFSHEEQRKRGWVTEMLDRADAKASESLHLCKPAPAPVPTPGSVWSHKNGNHYAVILISNAESERQDKYPTTVVYQNVENGKVYNRKLSDWHRSMSTVGSDELTESMRKASELLEDFRNKAKNILGKGKPDETIVAAAIYHGGTIFLPRPARHHTILQAMDTEMQIGGVINPQQQGFITSTGRYVNRTEAWYIALAAGQITRKTSGEDTPNLYSEDLW
jgi:hypothetical protein